MPTKNDRVLCCLSNAGLGHLDDMHSRLPSPCMSGVYGRAACLLTGLCSQHTTPMRGADTHELLRDLLLGSRRSGAVAHSLISKGCTPAEECIAIQL